MIRDNLTGGNAPSGHDGGNRSLIPQASDAWLKVEFEQNFRQLRDRDEKIIGLTKFYVSAVLSVGSVSVALMGLDTLETPEALIGALLLAAFVVGEMLLVWMVAFRGYFASCARQLNAIRRLYSVGLPEDMKWCIIQPTDPQLPRRHHPSSAHLVVIGLMSFVNAALASLGAGGLLSITSGTGSCYRAAVMGAVLLGVIIVNGLYSWWRLKKGDNDV